MTDPLTLDLERLHKLCIERWGKRITNRLLETKKQAPEDLRPRSGEGRVCETNL